MVEVATSFQYSCSDNFGSLRNAIAAGGAAGAGLDSAAPPCASSGFLDFLLWSLFNFPFILFLYPPPLSLSLSRARVDLE